jgi:hypothetical protein
LKQCGYPAGLGRHTVQVFHPFGLYLTFPLLVPPQCVVFTGRIKAVEFILENEFRFSAHQGTDPDTESVMIAAARHLISEWLDNKIENL